ncbi:MAG: NAD-dependent succinate-semialdehyde dehydrogenase [Gemmatimonadota bacterium]|nr:NAD-dependent succinate-semialdehyde dehydrogenase [Gemmatimonadota bacterium]
MIASINPATGETLRTFAELTEHEVDTRLNRAIAAFARHRLTTFADRARKMMRAAEILDREKAALGLLMTLEMGKPVKAARDEAAKCALACRYYAEHAETMLADESVATNASRSWITYQPIGVVLAVMPWNFPFWQVFRFATPALMAGNVGILKHASIVPQCALAIEDVLRRAGFEHDEFQTLLIGSAAVGPLLADPRIGAATLTGSEGAGSDVASRAGEAIKKTVLELGGSDPFIVMPSANVDDAAAVAVTARTINNGQSCIAAKRFIVHEAVAERFERVFEMRMRALRVGDPRDETIDVGPLATKQVIDDLEKQVKESIGAGARVVMGGARLDRPGNYFAPTILADIPEAAPAYAQELFGPVASLFTVRDIDEAISLANATTFGLGSSVWTSDRAEEARFVSDIEAGMVFVNGMVVSDPRLPFGGVKRSGYGRELGAFGIREFVNIKSVWAKDAAGAPALHSNTE